MGFETPKMPTPEEMTEIEKQRILSDAELLKGGAEIKIDEKGKKMLR
jgi:hemin uptake protein HemP